MSCTDCKYKGMYLKRRIFPEMGKGNKWYQCDYPLPSYATSKAIMNHWGAGCKVYVKQLTKQK